MQSPQTIEWADFARIDIRVGTVVRAEQNASARKPALTLWIDFGTALGPEGLIGRQVAAVVNFPPRQIGKVLSEVLVLGFPDADGEVVLVAPDRLVPDGGRLY